MGWAEGPIPSLKEAIRADLLASCYDFPMTSVGRRYLIAIVGLALLQGEQAKSDDAAANFGLEHGQWQVTTLAISPFMSGPKKSTTEVCIGPDNADPLSSLVAAPCKVTKRSATKTQLQWSVYCKDPKGPAFNGTGKMTTDGKSLSGKMHLRVEIGGNTHEITNEFSGKHLGDCPVG